MARRFLACPEMKALCIALFAAFASSCAIAAPPPASITLSTAKRSDGSLLFPARLTNASNQPVWYYAQFPELPFYSTFVRASDDAHWINRTQPMCGLGAGSHRLAPGASVSFRVWVSSSDAGNQLRVEIPIYNAANSKAKAQPVNSAATPIK